MEKSLQQYSNEDLTVEYARLFIGPFEVKAPPYGSIYLDGERRVMGDSTLEVTRLYEEAGLSGSKDFHDLPDHIAVELEFMYFLIFKEREAMEKSDFPAALELIAKQERFLDGFLVRWITPFCEKIIERSDNGFYTALADCTANFVKSTHPAKIREALSDGVLSAS
jgi:putative dimethyl sulfoxide reductase chaperone